MKKLIIVPVVFAVTLVAGTAQAGVLGRRNHGSLVQPAPVAVTPAPVATARTENRYRAFSYQPAHVFAAPAYNTAQRQSAVSSGFHDAGWKIRGF